MTEEEKKTTNDESSEEKPKKDKRSKLEKAEDEVLLAKAEAARWKNEYYKVFADMENLRKSLEKDHREVIKYRVEGFAENLLPVLDSFHMALSNEPNDPVTKNYLIGFQYVYKQLVEILDNEGIKEISPKVDEKFDEHTMQATDAEVSDKPAGTILKVILKGYKLHDHLIRPAMVVVAKKEEPKPEENTEENNKA